METNEVSTWSVLLACVVLSLAVIALIKTLARIDKWLKRGEEIKPTSANWGNILESPSLHPIAKGLDRSAAIQPKKENPFEELFCSLILPPDILCSTDITFLIIDGNYKGAIRTVIELLKKDRIKKEEEQELRKFCIDHCGPNVPYDLQIEYADKLYYYILNGKVTTNEDSPNTTMP